MLLFNPQSCRLLGDKWAQSTAKRAKKDKDNLPETVLAAEEALCQSSSTEFESEGDSGCTGLPRTSSLNDTQPYGAHESQVIEIEDSQPVVLPKEPAPPQPEAPALPQAEEPAPSAPSQHEAPALSQAEAPALPQTEEPAPSAPSQHEAPAPPQPEAPALPQAEEPAPSALSRPEAPAPPQPEAPAPPQPEAPALPQAAEPVLSAPKTPEKKQLEAIEECEEGAEARGHDKEHSGFQEPNISDTFFARIRYSMPCQ